MNPETRMPFSDASAWDLIARQIEREPRSVRPVSLRRPAGAIGYVMKVRLEANRPRLYVRVQIRHGRLHGRSFHYSEH